MSCLRSSRRRGTPHHTGLEPRTSRPQTAPRLTRVRLALDSAALASISQEAALTAAAQPHSEERSALQVARR
eukprot:scaffold106021_cov39-Phaeocystis_antarctica.AAC.1